MALATRCPNCQALFRVVADQLKLRGGLVRCGACRHVFDAIGSLSYVDDAAPSSAAPKAGGGKAAPPLTLRISPARPAQPKPAARDDARTASRDAQLPAAPAAPAASAPPKTSDRTEAPGPSTDGQIAESSVPTLLAPGADGSDRAGAADTGRRVWHADAPAASQEGRPRAQRRRVEQRARDDHVEPSADSGFETSAVDTDGAPEFLRRGPSRPRTGFSVVFGGGSVLLAALLLVQLAIAFRVELATRWPALRPSLVQLCAALNCSVGWPTRAELLAVVGTELQAIPGTDVLELTAVVRNRASFKVALPALEVTLTDTQNRALARKVFAPVDYLASAGEPSSRIDEGLAPGSDYTIRVVFEARGLAAAGFVVYPFYM